MVGWGRGPVNAGARCRRSSPKSVVAARAMPGGTSTSCHSHVGGWPSTSVRFHTTRAPKIMADQHATIHQWAPRRMSRAMNSTPRAMTESGSTSLSTPGTGRRSGSSAVDPTRYTMDTVANHPTRVARRRPPGNVEEDEGDAQRHEVVPEELLLEGEPEAQREADERQQRDRFERDRTQTSYHPPGQKQRQHERGDPRAEQQWRTMEVQLPQERPADAASSAGPEQDRVCGIPHGQGGECEHGRRCGAGSRSGVGQPVATGGQHQEGRCDQQTRTAGRERRVPRRPRPTPSGTAVPGPPRRERGPSRRGPRGERCPPRTATREGDRPRSRA